MVPKSWDNKVDSVTETRDMETMTMDELNGNLKTCEIKNQQEKSKYEHKKEKNLVLKDTQEDTIVEDEE